MKSHHIAPGFVRRIATLLVVGFATLTAPLAQAGNTNVGVSVSIDQPGFYGRINIGEQPPPLIYQQPVIIQQTPVAVHRRPIYLHVPPGHYKKWAKHCSRYNACGQPVYFVQEGWARKHHGKGHGHGHGHGKGH